MILYYLLVLSLPFVRHGIWGRNVAGYTVVKWLGWMCLWYGIASMLTSARVPRFLGTGQARAFLGFFWIAAISYYGHGSATGDENLMTLYTSHLIFLITTLMVVNSLDRLRWALLAAVGSIAWASLYLLNEWRAGVAAYGIGFRPGWVCGDANYFTASALLMLPLAFYFAGERSVRARRAFSIGCLSVVLLAMMVGASRGGFLGLTAACAFMVWRSERRARNSIVIAFTLLAALLSAPSTPLGRFFNPGQGDVEAEASRLELWRASLRIVQEHPATGVGLGNLRHELGSHTDEELRFVMAHNTYLEIAAELGIPGLLAFLGILIATFRSLGRVRSRSEVDGPPLVHGAASALQAGLLGFAVAIFFVSAHFLKLFWFAIFISACLPSLLEREPDEGPPSPGGADHEKTALARETSMRGPAGPHEADRTAAP